MEQLKQRYETYILQAIKVKKNAGPLAGIFGLGTNPQDDPMHVDFYEDVRSWVADFLKQDPDPEASFAAARFILCASEEIGQADSYWMMYAAHGLTRDLIPRLSGEHCAWLLDFYEKHYPKKERMPVQKEICKLLKKGASRR